VTDARIALQLAIALQSRVPGSFATQLQHAALGKLMPGREETWQDGKMRRRKSFGSSMMTHVAMFTSTPLVDTVN
jgi:hypothetical protein